MKSGINICAPFFCFIFATSIFGQSDFPKLKGPYLGQKPPRDVPDLFAPGMITTEYHEHSSPAFSHDGKELYWSVFINFWGPQVILTMRQENDRWLPPEVASFCGKYGDGNPSFSSDGKKIFFESRRPIIAGDPYTGNTDLWVVERQKHQWGTPRNLGNKINSEKWERGPSQSKNGTLYFCSMRDGGFGKMDLYRSEFVNGEFDTPQNLGPNINTTGHESWPFIAPDESYIIYESDSGDLFINFRLKDGTWSKSRNLSKKMNYTGSQNRFPLLSNDGKYLFFVSNRWLGNRFFDKPLNLEEVKKKAKEISNGLGNIFWVDAKVIEDLKPDHLK